MCNYSLHHIVNGNILFNAIVTRMNKYIIIIIIMQPLLCNQVNMCGVAGKRRT